MTTITAGKIFLDDRACLVTWAGMENGDVGSWEELSQFQTLTVNPSHSTSNIEWQGVNDPSETPASLFNSTETDAKVSHVVMSRFRYIRPLNNGDNTVSPSVFGSNQ